MTRSRGLPATLWLMLSALPSLASAQDLPDAVLVEVEACPESSLDVRVVLEQVRVELASDGIDEIRDSPGDPGAPTALARIHITTPCGAEPAFIVHIDDLVTQKSVERRFLLTDLADSAVPRALSLGIAELLRASWAELELEEPRSDVSPDIIEALRVRIRGLREARELSRPMEPAENPDAGSELAAPTPPEDAADVAPPEPLPPPPNHLSLGLGFVVRAFPGGSASPIGGQITLDVPLGSLMRLSFDGETVFGTSLDPLGTIELGLASGGIGLAAVGAIDVLRVAFGARVSAGASWANGRPVDASVRGSTGFGFVLLLGVTLELALRIAPSIELRFGIEAGAAPVGFVARVESIPVAGILGGSISASGGLAFDL